MLEPDTGDSARVDASLAMSRSFGDKRLKEHISSEPDVCVEVEVVDDDTEFMILASDGVWKVSGLHKFLFRFPINQSLKNISMD